MEQEWTETLAEDHKAELLEYEYILNNKPDYTHVAGSQQKKYRE